MTANHLPADELNANLIVEDLRKLAIRAGHRSPPIKIAYSATCYSTYVNTWEKAWEIVELVNRPNFGICLNTFHIARSMWGSLHSPYVPCAATHYALIRALDDMVELIDPKKIFLLQVADGERFESPIDKYHPWYDWNHPYATPHMCWSRGGRTFAFEPDLGGSMPVETMAVTIIIRLNYAGFVSMEMFSASTRQRSRRVPAEHVLRGMQSWKQLSDSVEANRLMLEGPE